MQHAMQHSLACLHAKAWPQSQHACHAFTHRSYRYRAQSWQQVERQRQTRRAVQAQAKKKGGGGQKKGPGSLMDIPKPAAPYLDTDVVMQNLLMVESFSRFVGRPITTGAKIEDIAQVLWDTPYAILAHTLEQEPAKYEYANKIGLDLFQASWEELIGQPSDVTNQHKDTDKEDRTRLLAEVKEKGTAEVRGAWRTGLKGRPICLNNAVMWNIEDPSGGLLGQAIAIHEWEFEDGTKGGPLAEAREVEERSTATTEELISQAEQQVQEQADRVRHMKEEEKLEKGDPVLDEAIAELLKRKEVLQRLQ